MSPLTISNSVEFNVCREESKTESEYTEEKVEYEVLPVKDENDMSGFMGDIERAAGKKQ